MKHLIIGFELAIGWTIGKVVAYEAMEYCHGKITKSKLYKEVVCKSKNENKNNSCGPYHETRMGFRP